MKLIPIHCDSCERARLVGASEITNGAIRCLDCGAQARTLPGESYAAEDVALFHELEAALRDAGLTPVDAGYLVTELEARHLDRPGQGLRRIAHMLPTLGVLELVVANSHTSMRKAEGMLALLLGAVARGRRVSGEIRLVTSVAPLRASKP